MSKPTSGAALIRTTLTQIAPTFDAEAVEIICSAVLAHKADDASPVWLAITGSPSDGKTLILDCFESKPIPARLKQPINDSRIITLDGLTPRTLISGFTKVKNAGLLEQIEKAVIFVKDLSPLQTSGASRIVFSQLRRCYDGQFALAFGSGKNFEWRGRLTVVIAGIRHTWSLDAELGPRLLTVEVRPARYSPALASDPGRRKLAAAISQALKISGLPKMTQQIQDAVMPFAEALSLARAYIHHDTSDRDITELPTKEEPHRLTKQLAALAAAHCALRGENLTNVMPTIVRVIIDSIPPKRRAVLRAVAKSGTGLTTADLIGSVCSAVDYDLSNSTVQREIDDLRILKLLIEHPTKLSNVGKPPNWIEPGKKWPLLANAPGLVDALKK